MDETLRLIILKNIIMKNQKFYLPLIIMILMCNLSFSQNNNYKNSNHIVNNLNTPTKIWTNGTWEIQKDGSKIWRQGYWRYKERSFQQKSQMLKSKISKAPKA